MTDIIAAAFVFALGWFAGHRIGFQRGQIKVMTEWNAYLGERANRLNANADEVLDLLRDVMTTQDTRAQFESECG